MFKVGFFFLEPISGQSPISVNNSGISSKNIENFTAELGRALSNFASTSEANQKRKTFSEKRKIFSLNLQKYKKLLLMNPRDPFSSTFSHATKSLFSIFFNFLFLLFLITCNQMFFFCFSLFFFFINRFSLEGKIR